MKCLRTGCVKLGQRVPTMALQIFSTSSSKREGLNVSMLRVCRLCYRVYLDKFVASFNEARGFGEQEKSEQRMSLWRKSAFFAV